VYRVRRRSLICFKADRRRSMPSLFPLEILSHSQAESLRAVLRQPRLGGFAIAISVGDALKTTRQCRRGRVPSHHGSHLHHTQPTRGQATSRTASTPGTTVPCDNHDRRPARPDELVASIREPAGVSYPREHWKEQSHGRRRLQFPRRRSSTSAKPV
jgi:hypothetical protein